MTEALSLTWQTRRDDGQTVEWDKCPARYDQVPGALLRSVRTEDGVLLAQGLAAKPGVYPYLTRDGRTILELVTAETLARVQDLATLGRKAVTLHHPPERVTPDNVETYSVGDLDGDVAIVQGGFVRVNLAVRSRRALDAINDGVDQLSLGYQALIDPTGGDHPVFGRYDTEQVGRKYNHLAIVPTGRHGPNVRLRADADAAMVPDPPPPGAHMNPSLVALLTHLGVSNVAQYSTDAAGSAEALRLFNERNDQGLSPEDKATMEADLATARADLATMTTDRDTEKGRADALQVKQDAADKAVQDKADAAERKGLRSWSESLTLDAETKALVDNNATKLPALRKALLTKVLQDADATLPEGATEAYVAASLDGFRAGSKTSPRADAWADLRRPPVPAPKPDQAPDRVDSAPSPAPVPSYITQLDSADATLKRAQGVTS